jgi:acetyltransferase-like isoleucine patch superfamily enzyme
MISILKRLFGALIYVILKHISLRFLLPKKYIHFIEVLRTESLVLQGARIGKGSIVRDNVFIIYPKNLIIGKNVTIGSYSKIFNYEKVIIEDEAELGPGLHIQTNDHIWSDISMPLGKQGSKYEQIKIGYGVFLGANVTILQGCIVDKLCVVAAGSVVTKNLKTGFLYGGIPAKEIQQIKNSKI